MTHYDRLKRKRLGDILVDEDLATEQVVIAALQEQQGTGRLLSDVLLEAREISEYELARVIVEQYQAPFIDLKGYTLHKDLIQSFPADLLHRHGIVPLDRFGRQVCFACQEIPSPEVVEQLKEHSPAGIYVYVASAVEVRQSLIEHAPLDRKAVAAAKAEEAALPVAKLAEDDAWQGLFDTANESILSELDEE